MNESKLEELANLSMALSDKTRLSLLALMADGEVSVGYLAETLGESQPKISRHLAYLRGSGLVSTRRDGKWIYYGLETVSNSVADVLTEVLNQLNGKESTVQNINSTAYEDHASDEAYMNDWEPNELEVYLL